MKAFSGSILASLLSLLSPIYSQQTLAAPKAVDGREMQEVERLLKSAPNSYMSHFRAGQLYIKAGSIGQAQEEFQKSIKCKDAQPAGYKELALLYMRSLDAKQAISVIDEAVKKFPKDYGVLLTAGYVYHNQRQLSEALAFYQRALAVNSNAEIYLAIADVQNNMGKPKEALVSLDKAQKVGKMTAEARTLARFERAKTLIALARFSEAAIELEGNYKEKPASVSNGKLYISVLEQMNKKDKALEVACVLLSSANGKQMEMSKAQVRVYLLSMSDTAAGASIKKAESLIGDKKLKARMHFALGDIYDRLNKFEPAIAQYQAGLKFDDQFARAYLRLGEDLESARKDYKGALANYLKAQTINARETVRDQEISLRLDALRKKMK